MKNFLAVFTGKPANFEAWQKLPESEQQERAARGIKAWHAWVAQHQASIVEMGAPLGRTKRIAREGISDIRNELSGFTIVRAETHEDAASLFLEHPHFTIFPGDDVQVMECMPIPKM
jgi:hemolysin-activating ACP:hemolysin acyltransferase